MSGSPGVLSEEQRESFRSLLNKHGDRIYSFAMTLTRNENEASDLTAEAFAKALKSFWRYDPARSFESWVFKIAQNIHFDRKRRLKSKPTVPLGETGQPEDESASLASGLPDGSNPPDLGLSQEETKHMVRRALERVPEPFREPLVLCDLLGMSYEEIAGMLELPVGTVRSRIFRARQIFRPVIEPYWREGGKLWTAAKT